MKIFFTILTAFVLILFVPKANSQVLLGATVNTVKQFFIDYPQSQFVSQQGDSMLTYKVSSGHNIYYFKDNVCLMVGLTFPDSWYEQMCADLNSKYQVIGIDMWKAHIKENEYWIYELKPLTKGFIIYVYKE